jgi:DNA modification methylase/predicted RNA-binding Zn-ribbon protein involved in translation (DUF1610 family)
MNEKIKCLGKEFNSEDERRDYFRNELRKKLPALKKMDGFPIGEDEDIINLSDPPFYTACPNPWLNDFIQKWEDEKIELENNGIRKSDFKVVEPYAADISEGKNNPVYSAHNYHTKVPHPAIMRYILKYTQPGDIVFDGFAGTGMTGLASSLVENPDLKTKLEIEQEFRERNEVIVWGKRKSICSDLSPVASFIASNYNKSSKIEILAEVEDKILKLIDLEYGWMFETLDERSGRKGTIDFTVYSDVFECPNCANEIIFLDHCTDVESGNVKNTFTCPECQKSLTKLDLKKVEITVFDEYLNQSIKTTKTLPVLIQYRLDGKIHKKRVDNNDIETLKKIDAFKNNSWVPVELYMGIGEGWGDTWRSGIHKGINYVHQFYTKRALVVLSKAFELCNTTSDPLMARFIVEQCVLGMARISRYVPTHFSQVNQYLSGTMYIGSQVVDVNMRYILDGKLKRLVKALEFMNSGAVISTQDACHFHNLDEMSVDYIFTDPPFGANLMYSELNFLWESWLKIKTNYKNEAIENKSHGKSLFDYHHLMSKAFSEYYRILKPGKWMTVEFSNTSAAVWNGIQNAIQSAGFIIANVSALDKKQGSFKAVTTVTAVKQDLVISCYKPSLDFDKKFNLNNHENHYLWDFITEHLNHLPIHVLKNKSTTAVIERSPKILFDRLIAFYIQRGLPVPIDSGKFQQELKVRYEERDGMYFTKEQVQEYDRKKSEYPELVQLSLLVSSEQDGVLWLKNLLSEQILTYQEIQPLWMQALAGVRKGDIIPELADILEENFLKDSNGKWYVANPENESDLEKLKNKRLLKQFDAYKEEASKPKGKIKEARVEALRVGFKQCYQEKDFKTIVQIGDRIPNNLLMEDEVLLQFYDIAISRV